MTKQLLTGLVFVLTLLAPRPQAFAAVDAETYQKQYEESLARMEQESGNFGEKTLERYRRKLGQLEAAAQKEGDLDGVLAARAEMKRLETDPALPDADSIKHEGLKELVGKGAAEIAQAKAAADRQRQQLAGRFAAQLRDYRDRSSRMGDRESAAKADQLLQKLVTENRDVTELDASPVPPVAPAKPAAMPVYAKAFPRLASSLAAYTGFDGLPDTVAFAAGPEVLDLNGVKAVPAGFKGVAAAFTGGNSHISASFPPLMSNATEASLCIWFKSAAVKGTLACLYAGEDAGITLYIDHEGRLEGHSGHASNGAATSSRPVNDGQWHFGVLSCGQGRVTLYVDGAKVNSTSSRGKVCDPNVRLLLGASENRNIFKPSESYFDWELKGELDEFLLYTKALNENEVRSLHMMMRSARP